MRESLRRRLKLPPLHHHPPPPPPPTATTKSEHHPPNDDDLEEGELKDVDPLDLTQNKDDPVQQDREPIVPASPVKDGEAHDRGVAADDGGDGKPECPVEDHKVELEESHDGDGQVRPVVPVLEDRVMGDDVNQGVREERGNQSGELESRVRGGGGGEEEVVMERNETEQVGGEVVVKVAVDDVVQPEGEQHDKITVTDSLGEGDHRDGDGIPKSPVEEEREITTEQQRPGGGETVENDIAMEAEEERGQPGMPVEVTQNLIDHQHEATAGENEGRTDDEQVEKVTEKDGVDDDEEDGPPPGWESGPPVKPLPPLTPPPPPPPPEKGQLVCGSCRRLLSYPRGFKHVQCSCCQTVNYVLEEHQVGQVQCGNCLLLLMYPYGAQSVRCCSCRVVTDIGDHNKRPRLSEQQSRACRPFCIPL